MTHNTEPIMVLPELYQATVIKRPSKTIKSPYVADIIIDGNTDEVLAHTPALGCCGLADTGSVVYVYKIKEYNVLFNRKQTETKCDYRIVIGTQTDNRLDTRVNTQLIGIAPKLAEQITYNLLTLNKLPFIDIAYFDSEKVMKNSRFDFIGRTSCHDKFIMEVKNVPLADFEDIDSKTRKKNDYTDTTKWLWNNKIAYFPDGYRKKKNAPVSERAIKHLHDLTEIKQESKTLPTTVMTRCIMLYIIQRSDVSSFTPSIIDPFYREAFKKAKNEGVEMYAICVEWKLNKCYYVKQVPIII